MIFCFYYHTKYIMFKKFSSYFQQKSPKRAFLHLSIVFLILPGFLSFFVFYYPDIETTMEHSILLWKAFLNGRVLQYYEYCLEYSENGTWPACYSFLIYVIFAVYNLPIFLLNMFFRIDIHSVFSLLWCKSILIWFSLGTAIILKKICDVIDTSSNIQNHSNLMLFTSLNFVGIVCILGQYDIIAISLILSGLYFYLKGNEKLFLFFFFIGMPIKSFALLYFIPLLLLKEKRIFLIIIKTIFVYSYFIIEPLLFLNDDAYSFTVKRIQLYGIDKLLGVSLKLGENISWFLIIFSAICFYCYLHPSEESSNLRKPIFVTLLVSSAICVFCALNTYWIIFIVPFWILAITTQKRFVLLSLLLESIESIMYTIVAILYKGPYNYIDISKRLLLSRLFILPNAEHIKYGTTKSLFLTLGLDRLSNLWATIHIFCIIAFVFLYFLDMKKNPKLISDIKGISFWQLLLGRAFLLIGFISILLYSNLKTVAPALISTTDNKSIVSDTTLINNQIIQFFSTDQERIVSRLSLYFQSDTNRRNFTSLSIQIQDCTINKTLFENRVGSNRIDSKKALQIKLNEILLVPQHTYAIVLSGNSGIKHGKKYDLYPVLAETPIDSLPNILFNGTLQDTQLYFEIR